MKKLDNLIESFFENIDAIPCSAYDIEKDFEVENVRKNSCLVEIKNNSPIFNCPNSEKHSRFSDLKYLIETFCKNNKTKDFKFLVALNDVSFSSIPSFATIRPNNSYKNIIPIPMGNQRGIKEKFGVPVKGWDEYIDDALVNTHDDYPWDKKINKAVFRGRFTRQTFAVGHWGKVRAERWDQVHRGLLYKTCKDNDLFDVGFNQVFGDLDGEEIPLVTFMPFDHHQKYKYIINVGNSADWAERLRMQLFANSVTVLHQAECVEWFYPLLKPYVHYIPTNIFFTDLIENIEWCERNEDICQQIVKNANNFAKKYINEKTMHYVFEKTLKCFSDKYEK